MLTFNTEPITAVCDEKGDLVYVIRKNGHVLVYKTIELSLTEFEKFMGMLIDKNI